MEKVQKNISIPLYYQIQEVLEGKILSSEWAEGHQLATEKELAEYFSVSTITVKRAIHELVNKGLLYRIRGKGTFVSRTLHEENIFNIVSFGHENKVSNPHKILNASIEESNVNILKKLALQKGDLVFKVDRLKIEGSEAIAIERTYIVHELAPNFSMARTKDELIYNIIREEPGIRLGKAKVYLSTTIVDEEEAKLLNLKKGTPLITIERISFLDDGRPIEYSLIKMRQDMANYFFEIDLKSSFGNE